MDASTMHELDELEAALNDLTIETTTVTDVIEDDNDPMTRTTLDELLAGYALIKGDQVSRTFVGSKAIHRNPDVILNERKARERIQDRNRKRLIRAQAKRTRIEVAREAKPVDLVRMSACLTLLGNLIPVVSTLTIARYNRFRRYLGDTLVDDISSDAVLRIAEVLSKSDVELVELAAATLWLKDAPQPYVAADGPRASGRLLGTMISVIGNVIQEAYRNNTTTAWVQTINEHGETVYEKKDTTLESFELLETIAWNTRTDIDDMISKSKASNKPPHEYSAPGMREKRLFARMVIDCAIKARGLDWLANMLLDPERVRTDGSFKWTENADTIWAGFSFPMMNTDSPRLKAHYAKRAVSIAFSFLPDVITATYEIINDPVVMYHLDVHTTQELVMAAAQYRPARMVEPMDGGAGLAFTVSLMDDPEKCRRALAMVRAHEED
jgi:hypothetical protein